MLEKLPGTYWMIGSDSPGYSVHRQGPGNGTNSKQLFLFYKTTTNAEGRHFADTLVDAGSRFMSFSGPRRGGGASRSSPATAGRAPINERTAAKDKQIAGLEARAAADGAAPEEGNKVTEGGSSPNGKIGKTTAGWRKRCIKLILAMPHEWNKCTALANEWADTNHIRPVIEMRE
ncbi:unnamed protein product [Prorocentrum cordatum]|uniref:Uncharacterized protein n=1 Tax=Prorocentrum cordatum TaxID=2364126 RepID=A0ABN9S9L6_9DINO|nr:unnamed protein product [Polarella glacialis]